MANRRRIFLINKHFQFRFAFYVCSFLIVLSFAFPLIVADALDVFIAYIARDPNGPAIIYLQKTKQELLLFVIFIQIVFLSLAFVISLFLSHRVAGPIHKVGMYFRNVRNGKLDDKMVFRKTDYFQELAGDYNAMMDSIRDRIYRSEKAVHQSIPRLESLAKSAPDQQKTELEAILTLLKHAENPPHRG